MRMLGIDPGFERLGIAILDTSPQGKQSVVFSECYKTSARLDFPERLRLVGNRIREVIREYEPEALSIETLFLSNNQKTAMRVAEARGVILCESARAGLKVFEASPPQIKIATTGYGKSDKAHMMKMVRMLVTVDADKKSDDELDAIAIALTGLAHMRAEPRTRSV